jgi:hypothetical protein
MGLWNCGVLGFERFWFLGLGLGMMTWVLNSRVCL